jgi:two-component system chemotaxis response regulator CheB
LTADPTGPDRPVQREVVVIGASAGGVDALIKTVAGLPPELPAAVLVVVHIAATRESVLPSILDRSGKVPVTAARDGERIERGHVYIAPPDVHMLLSEQHIRLSRGPRENGSRPAIDPLFRSAARSYGSRAIGVILSGTLDDGTAGLRFLKRRGGAAVVQDPSDALYPGMPESAIAGVAVDRVVPVVQMADTICALLDEPVDPSSIGMNPGLAQDPPDLVELPPQENDAPSGDPTALTCPECGGVLHQDDDGSVSRFSCQVGHVYSPESLVEGQSEALEGALWAALRSLEERADLLRRMARRAHSDQRRQRLDERVEQVERDALVVHGVAVRLGRAAPESFVPREAGA